MTPLFFIGATAARPWRGFSSSARPLAAFGFVGVVAAAANTPIAAAVMGIELLPPGRRRLCRARGRDRVPHGRAPERLREPEDRAVESAGLDVRMDVAIGDLTRSGVQVRPGSLADRAQRAGSRIISRRPGEPPSETARAEEPGRLREGARGPLTETSRGASTRLMRPRAGVTERRPAFRRSRQKNQWILSGGSAHRREPRPAPQGAAPRQRRAPSGLRGGSMSRVRSPSGSASSTASPSCPPGIGWAAASTSSGRMPAQRSALGLDQASWQGQAETAESERHRFRAGRARSSSAGCPRMWP